VARFLPQLPGYLYAFDEQNLYVNLYMAKTAVLPHPLTPIRIVQETAYPWNGGVCLTLNPEQAVTFTLHLRIPGWAQGQPVPSDLYCYSDLTGLADLSGLVNGEPIVIKIVKGFVAIRRTWQAGDVVTLELPMPVQRVLGHEQVVNNRGRVALERGPLVYCVEGVDNGRLADLCLPDTMPLTTESRPDLLSGVTVIHGEGLVAIPYYAWANRGVGEMAVWLSRTEN
jgi:DUF1680 family protein